MEQTYHVVRVPHSKRYQVIAIVDNNVSLFATYGSKAYATRKASELNRYFAEACEADAAAMAQGWDLGEKMQ